MNQSVIDAHIHLDLYLEKEQSAIIQQLEKFNIHHLISVSTHLQSARRNLALSKQDDRILPAFGYHPEQDLPSVCELIKLQHFMEENLLSMIAIGEVGLPYYLRQKNEWFMLEPYIEVLRLFIQTAAKLSKPIVLHAVYNDAPVICDLLEEYSIQDAHFHWFKGDIKTIKRLIRNGYHISITPDVLYETEIQQLVQVFPLNKMMVETDGPWPFVGKFKHQMTHPWMLHQTIQKIAQIKRLPLKYVYENIYQNTCQFYRIK